YQRCPTTVLPVPVRAADRGRPRPSRRAAQRSAPPHRPRLRVPRPPPRVSAFCGDRFELSDTDARLQPSGVAWVEPAGAELERRRGPGGDRRLERLVERPLRDPRSEERSEEHVAGAHRRDRLDLRSLSPVQEPSSFLPEQGVTPVLRCDQDVARPDVRDPLERVPPILLIAELVSDESLRLALVRGEGERLGLRAAA